MPDTTHWIVLRDTIPPYEIEERELKNHLHAHGRCVYLVTTHMWRDYQKTQERLDTIHAEMKTCRRATFVIGIER